MSDHSLYEPVFARDGGETEPGIERRAGAGTDLGEELRLCRVQILRALVAGDDKLALAWLSSLQGLARVQAGSAEDESELRSMLLRIGEEVRRRSGSDR